MGVYGRASSLIPLDLFAPNTSRPEAGESIGTASTPALHRRVVEGDAPRLPSAFLPRLVGAVGVVVAARCLAPPPGLRARATTCAIGRLDGVPVLRCDTDRGLVVLELSDHLASALSGGEG